MVKRGIFKDKTAQFYLVAAIIIALVVFSLVTISNYAKENKQETVVFDLKNVLNFETGRVVDFALYNKSDIIALLENWTNLYVSSQQGKDIENWFFVYGNPSNLTVLVFSNGSTGSVNLETGGGTISLNMIGTKVNKTTVYGEYVNITFGDFNYSFDTRQGNNFAFLIKKEGNVADSTTKGKRGRD